VKLKEDKEMEYCFDCGKDLTDDEIYNCPDCTRMVCYDCAEDEGGEMCCTDCAEERRFDP
jgi:hypothetical protein